MYKLYFKSEEEIKRLYPLEDNITSGLVLRNKRNKNCIPEPLFKYFGKLCISHEKINGKPIYNVDGFCIHADMLKGIEIKVKLIKTFYSIYNTKRYSAGELLIGSYSESLNSLLIYIDNDLDIVPLHFCELLKWEEVINDGITI